MTEQIEIHLIDGPDPEASIDFDLLGPLATAFGRLSHRLVRWQADRSGRGRSPDVLAAVGKMRLTSVESGSTTLSVTRGAGDMLSSLDEADFETERTLWTLLESVVAGRPLADVSPPVAQSVLELVEALDRAAPSVLIRSLDRPEHHVLLQRAGIAREPWKVLADEVLSERRIVSGVLQAADLTRRTFRLHDDAGNRIYLGHVEDLDRAAGLLGQRVLVTGELHQAHGQWRIDRLQDLVVDPGVPLAEPAELRVELSKSGPLRAEDDLLTDDEFDAFLAAARGQ